jgi:hypothetical protein
VPGRCSSYRQLVLSAILKLRDVRTDERNMPSY